MNESQCEQESTESVEARRQLNQRTYSYENMLDAFVFGVKEGELTLQQKLNDRVDFPSWMRKKFLEENKLIRQCDSLRAEVAELQKDKERMEWLEYTAIAIELAGQPPSRIVCSTVPLRPLLDTAMSAENK